MSDIGALLAGSRFAIRKIILFASSLRLGKSSSDHCANPPFTSFSLITCHKSAESSPAFRSSMCFVRASGRGPKVESSLNKTTTSGSVSSSSKSKWKDCTPVMT